MQEVVDAKEKQLKNLIENEAFEEVEFLGKQATSMKWIITKK